jgi:hypothetical protein
MAQPVALSMALSLTSERGSKGHVHDPVFVISTSLDVVVVVE